MESPFANKSVCVYLEPFLNTYYKSYQNIITFNSIPAGPLANMVTPFSATKLSPFQQSGVFFLPFNCTYILLRYPKSGFGNHSSLKNVDYFMGADDIPSLFSYLQNNGYIIDTDLTHMLQKSDVSIGGISEQRISGNRKFVCMFHYNSV
jgi:hypothetical protein